VSSLINENSVDNSP